MLKLKVAVNLNRIPESYKIKDDFELARLYHLKHGVELTFIFKDIDIHGYTSVWSGNRFLLNQTQTLVTIDPTANVNMFVFDQGEWATPAGSPFPLKPDTPNGQCFMLNSKPFINIGRFTTPDWIQIAHELVHALSYISNLKGFPVQDTLDSYYKNSTPDAVDGNFAQMWTLLQPYLKSLQTPTGYKYFKASEVIGLKVNFVKFLDKARGYAETPFKITSGYRTPEHNLAVGGVTDSSHNLGLAVDLLVTDSVKGGKILKGLMKALLEDNLPIRLGFYNDGHCHVDLDSSKPNPCYWIK